MRIKTLLFALLVCGGCVSAQDIITKADGSIIKAKVEEVSETAVKYHRYDNLSGPVYSLPINAIIKIAYENGVIDSFENAPIAASAAESMPAKAQTELDEAKLLRLDMQFGYGKKVLSPQDYIKKAKTYRLTGWIGGGAMFLVGALLPVCIDDDDLVWLYEIVGAPIAGAGVVWCLSWNLAANHQRKLARNALGYSIPVIEHEVFSSQGKSLAATFNMMGNNSIANHNAGLGFGIKFTF